MSDYSPIHLKAKNPSELEGLCYLVQVSTGLIPKNYSFYFADGFHYAWFMADDHTKEIIKQVVKEYDKRSNK